MSPDRTIQADSISTRVRRSFSNLDDVVQHLENLHRNGYRSLGKWNLAQVCEHLSDWMSFMIDGYPKAPLPVAVMLWAIRVSVGKSLLRKILKQGTMTAGSPTMAHTVYPGEGLDDEKSLLRFKETVARFQAYQREYHPSPLFGKFSLQDGQALQSIHCAHHVSFLVPFGDDRIT